MATIEQIAKCKEIFELAMLVTSQGGEVIHAEYIAHIDAFNVYKAGQIEGWDCNARVTYLGEESIARHAKARLEDIKSELNAMLKRDADGVPV